MSIVYVSLSWNSPDNRVPDYIISNESNSRAKNHFDERLISLPNEFVKDYVATRAKFIEMRHIIWRALQDARK